MANLTVEQIIAILPRLIGCGSCGRFGLYVESHDSEHTRGWMAFHCPDCLHVMKFPVREVPVVEEVAAGAKP